MKEGTPTKTECKESVSNSTTPTRYRVSPKAKDSPIRKEAATKGLVSPSRKPRAKSVQPDVKDNQNSRRSLFLNNKLNKSGENGVGSQKGMESKEVKIAGRTRNGPFVEQFAKPRRGIGRNENDPDGKRKELVEKDDLNETLVKNLQSEILVLKEQLDKAQSLNIELESQNKKLIAELAAAGEKITALSSRSEQKESTAEYQTPKFKEIQKLIANKLENSTTKKEETHEGNDPKSPLVALINPVSIKAANEAKKVKAGPSPPPPPPPPPPGRPIRAAATQKTPSIVEFYHSLTKNEAKEDPPLTGNRIKPVVSSAHNSIVGEIQNRSAHLLAIKADIETKGEFINDLIAKVQAATFTAVEDVVKFVEWLDGELSSLADERAVLKHFVWPERKADAMREAAIEYRDLKRLESEMVSYKDDSNIPYGVALKKMAGLLDKSEQRIQRLIKLRNSVMLSYKKCNIPTDWMLDSGVISKIKQASMKLVRVYMRRVKLELESVRNSERESTQEALLLQGVQFAYRAHQFTGGLDSDTMCAFEEMRQHVPGHVGQCRELLAGIPSS